VQGAPQSKACPERAQRAERGPRGCVGWYERGEVFRRRVSRENTLKRPEGAAGSIGVLRLDLLFAARTTNLAQDDSPQDYSKRETAARTARTPGATA